MYTPDEKPRQEERGSEQRWGRGIESGRTTVWKNKTSKASPLKPSRVLREQVALEQLALQCQQTLRHVGNPTTISTLSSKALDSLLDRVRKRLAPEKVAALTWGIDVTVKDSSTDDLVKCIEELKQTKDKLVALQSFVVALNAQPGVCPSSAEALFTGFQIATRAGVTVLPTVLEWCLARKLTEVYDNFAFVSFAELLTYDEAKGPPCELERLTLSNLTLMQLPPDRRASYQEEQVLRGTVDILRLSDMLDRLTCFLRALKDVRILEPEFAMDIASTSTQATLWKCVTPLCETLATSVL